MSARWPRRRLPSANEAARAPQGVSAARQLEEHHSAPQHDLSVTQA